MRNTNSPNMKQNELVSTAISIVGQANKLRQLQAPCEDVHVSYCAIFCQSDDEFHRLVAVAESIGILANNTATGPVYVVPPIETVIGALRVVKIRKPDPTRREQGDADFAIADYQAFKAANLKRKGFSLIEREHFEMLELVHKDFNVRAYFSNPPVERHPGIRETLAEQDE